MAVYECVYHPDWGRDEAPRESCLLLGCSHCKDDGSVSHPKQPVTAHYPYIHSFLPVCFTTKRFPCSLHKIQKTHYKRHAATESHHYHSSLTPLLYIRVSLWSLTTACPGSRAVCRTAEKPNWTHLLPFREPDSPTALWSHQMSLPGLQFP